MRNLLIVEDHDDHRNWWLENLHTVFPGAIVSAAVSLAEARRVIEEKVFTLAILDINLPDGSGIDLMRELTINTPDCYGVICSVKDSLNSARKL